MLKKNESSKIINVDSASIPTLCFQGLATFFSPVCCVYVATKLKATLRTFCADAVLAPREDRHVSSPSDCFFGYHSPSAITRSLGLWFLSATSRSFLRLWLHPGRLAPDRSPSFFTMFMDLNSIVSRGFYSPVTSRTLLLIFDYLRKVRESNPRAIADLLLSRELPYHSANLPFFGLSIPNQPAFVCNSNSATAVAIFMVRKELLTHVPSLLSDSISHSQSLYLPIHHHSLNPMQRINPVAFMFHIILIHHNRLSPWQTASIQL